ncbi:MAG: hypothetical protein ACI8TQ_001549 [Planctomycetota bacterium]|jgi:HEAT repeat protein
MSIAQSSRIRTLRALGACLPLAFATFGALGCGQAEIAEKSTPSVESSGILAEQAIGDMVAALTPPEESVVSSVKDDWLRRRRQIMARMKRGDEEMGSLLIQAFRTGKDYIIPVRSGLIEAAAYSNPKAAAPILVELIQNYGEDIGLRTDACRFLGEAAPEQAIEVLGGILFSTERSSTMPNEEAMLDGWLDGHRKLGTSPGIQLANIATDIQRDHSTRHLAIRALGDYPSKISFSALDEVIHESSGNSYMRILAAQSMVTIGEPEQYCPIFALVYERESDINFQVFLANMIETHCQ